jgi:hypothetical protein
MSSEITIITTKTEWNEALSKMSNIDFYFTYDYHNLSVNQPNSFFLFSFKNQNYQIVLPLIKRPIFDTEYFDATSVYGYAGPLASHIELPGSIVDEFQIELKQFCIKNNIISLFSRLHPFIKNDFYLNKLGDIIELSQTVFIDLTSSQEEQYKQFRKGVKSDIKALQREGYSVVEDTELTYLHEFISLYNENMDRVQAASNYYFSQNYYKDFFQSKEIGAKLFIVKDGNDIAGGSIIVFAGNIIQYHLSGTKETYLKNSPVRLLLDNIRLNYTNSKYQIFHLGGGVGSNEDSLFNFKAGFSKERLDFKIWKYIVNEKAYSLMLDKFGFVENSFYFPLYRSIEKPL